MRAVPWLADHQFKKGVSGNIKGRPKGCKNTLRGILRLALEKKGYTFAIKKMKDRGVDIHDGTHADLINAILLWNAEKGDIDAIKEIYKQTEIPLGNQLNFGDFNSEDNAINLTVNVVKVSNTQTNIQNNIKKVINVVPKKVKLR